VKSVKFAVTHPLWKRSIMPVVLKLVLKHLRAVILGVLETLWKLGYCGDRLQMA